MIEKTIRIALIGNPNSGKSSIFNALVKNNQEVGNYPGVTVEKKTGFITYKNWNFIITDLPGIYNLTTQSAEERIARDFLLQEPLDLIIQVIDSTHVGRHLFLTTQLMELGLPVMVALNMWDLAQRRKLHIDIEQLSQLLEIVILPTIGTEKKGLVEILSSAIELKEKKKKSLGVRIPFSPEIEGEIQKISSFLVQELPKEEEKHRRFFSLLLLEEDPSLQNRFSDLIYKEVHNSIAHLQKLHPQSIEMQLSMKRHEEIAKLTEICLKKNLSLHSLSDRMDKILLHRIWGLPIFLVAIYLTFQLTFTLASFPSKWLQSALILGATHLQELSSPVFVSFLVKGVFGGVGSVLIFLPNIFLLFLALSLLELSGYMVRAAFLMDRIMHKMGLHGKSFLPMLLGFGCTVPAILATRTLESKRDRYITILILPLIACSAKLVVFGLLIPPFFSPSLRPLILFTLYFTGILLAIVIAKCLRKVFWKEELSSFLVELPSLRFPSFSLLLKITSWKCWHYVKKAGSIILLFSIFIWALSYFPKGPLLDVQAKNLLQKKKDLLTLQDPALKKIPLAFFLSHKKEILREMENNLFSSLPLFQRFFEDAASLEKEKNKHILEESYLGKIGQFIAPLFYPLGFDWRISTSLLGAFAAKEIFISQIGILFSDSGEDSLEQRLRTTYTPLISFCIMLFLLISTPCMATFATTRKETSTQWALFQGILLTVIAYGITWVIFQIGSLF